MNEIKVMQLDPSLPETYSAPIDPKTGEIWWEKQTELCDLATEARYEGNDEERKAAVARYLAARHGVQFEERPYICQHTLILGAAYKDVVVPSLLLSCHPNTWAKLSDETKAEFKVDNSKVIQGPGQTIRFTKKGET